MPVKIRLLGDDFRRRRAADNGCNAVPGLVLGILIGKGVEESGWNRVTKVMMVAIVALFVLSGFFRGFDMKMIESFHLTVPNWLDMIHNSLSGK